MYRSPLRVLGGNGLNVPYYGFKGINKTALLVGSEVVACGKDGRLKYVNIKDTQEIDEGTFVQLQLVTAAGNFPLISGCLGSSNYQCLNLDLPVLAGQRLVITYGGISSTFVELQWLIE